MPWKDWSAERLGVAGHVGGEEVAVRRGGEVGHGWIDTPDTDPW